MRKQAHIMEDAHALTSYMDIRYDAHTRSSRNARVQYGKTRLPYGGKVQYIVVPLKETLAGLCPDTCTRSTDFLLAALLFVMDPLVFVVPFLCVECRSSTLFKQQRRGG